MPKRNFVAYLDADLIEVAKSQGINISQEFNIYLSNRVIGLRQNQEENLETKEKILIEQLVKMEVLKKEIENIKKLKKEKVEEDLEKVFK